MFAYNFNKQVYASKLQSEIAQVFPSISYITCFGLECSVHFSQELTLSEQETLSTIIDSHVYSLPVEDVTARQIRQALILSGVSLSQIETALDGLSEPTRSLAIMEWEYSNMFERNRPLVAQVGALLGWTSQQLDDLWALARTL